MSRVYFREMIESWHIQRSNSNQALCRLVPFPETPRATGPRDPLCAKCLRRAEEAGIVEVERHEGGDVLIWSENYVRDEGEISTEVH